MNQKRLAQFISFLCHPVNFSLLMPFLIVHHRTEDLLYSIKWTIFSGGFLFLGLLFFYLVRPKEFFSDFDISKKEKRHIFYSIALLISVLYFIVSILFKGILFPLSIVALGIILGIVSFDIVTYYSKVSIHVAVITAYVVTIAMLYGIIPFFATVWLIGAVGWARLYLHKHTRFEIIGGMILGTVVTIGTFGIGLLLQK